MNENETKTPPEFSDEEMKMPIDMMPIEEEHHGKLAVILGLLIVLLILIMAGLYLWYLNSFNQPIAAPVERFVPEMPNEPEMQNAEANVQQQQTVSTSNEIDAIEADIESTNLDELDAELNAIDAELDAAIN